MSDVSGPSAAPASPPFDAAAEAYRAARVAHWDAVARRLDVSRGWSGAYHRRLATLYRHLVSPGSRVLELGCGTGDLLAALAPARGVGVDFSPEMLARARARHPELTFVEADAHALPDLGGPFDVVVLSDLLNDVWDVQRLLSGLAPHLAPGARVVTNSYSRLWELPLAAAQRLGLAKRNLTQSWLTVPDVTNLLALSGLETIRSFPDTLLPLPIPLLAPLANRVLAHVWPFRLFAWTNVVVARAAPNGAPATKPRVSVIVPARNESGNVPAIFERTPELGSGTELVFVEGHSRDDTYAAIERAIASSPRPARLLRQTGEGKGDAVRAGFAAATGDVLMILDADLTTPPEDLPRFYEALVSGKGEFVNGVRLVYPMENEAMRVANLLGNKFFSLAFSWLLGQPIKDTLCGTKVLWRKDYERIARNRTYFGDFDPFGDFDLLFGAAKLNLKICEVPVRYRERTFGTTNIRRWSHGALLFKMVLFAAGRIKFR